MNRKAYASILTLVFMTLAVFLTGCNNSSPPAETIAVGSGSGQSVAVGAAFAAPLVAVVTAGSGASGLAVTFTAPATGASGTFASTGTATETDTTNANGFATSSAFTANTTAGAYTVTATVAGVTTPASFSLTNLAGAPATITVVTGTTPQSTTVNTAFTTPVAVTVLDADSNPISGASVTFAAPATGASGTFATSTTNTETDATGANGVATASAFTANGFTGAYAVTATVGTLAPVAFNLTNVAGGTVVFIGPTGGTPQSTAISTAFAAPLVATVTTGGVVTPGATVTFTAPALTGASGTFASNGTITETDTTDVNGNATSSTFTANATTGAYIVAATVTGATAPANFSLTNTPVSTYAFYLSGLEVTNPVPTGPNFYALAGAVAIGPDGTVMGGEQDYNDAVGLTSSEPTGDTITGGTLTVDATTGQGTLTLITNNTNVGVAGTETLGVQFVNANHALIVQFDGSATSSGSLDLQNLTSNVTGGFAFTLSGVDPTGNSVVYGGVFSLSSGTATGVYDVDDFGAAATPTLNTAFTGTVSAADSYGRGTVTGTGIATTLVYYNVGPEAVRLIDVDTTDSAVGSAFGQGTTAGSFSSTSLGNSVFGVESNSFGNPYAAAGQFATTPAAGTFAGVADDNESGSFVSAVSIGGNYSIASNGYGSLTITPGDLQDVSVLGIYLTDPTLNLNDPNNTTGGGGALVADLDGFTLNGTGVVTPQTDTTTADFTGNYAFGAQEYNPDDFWEFDVVGQGSVTGGVLSGTGLVSDPGSYFPGDVIANTGVSFSGTATPDPVNAGRYTIYPLSITVVAGSPIDFRVAIYQASGTQLFWVDDDTLSLFLGPIEQQGSLTGLPAAKRGAAKSTKPKKK